MDVHELDLVVGLGKVVQALSLMTCVGEVSGSNFLTCLRVMLVFTFQLGKCKDGTSD